MKSNYLTEKFHDIQLFAAGYSAACFTGAVKVVAVAEKIKLPEDLEVDAEVGNGPIPGGYSVNA